MKFLKVIILYPISLMYGMVVSIRNTLFDFNFLKSTEFDVSVISVGNITVGGTGKTPVTEYIVKTLQDEYRVAVLSRGYKRKTRGFVLADAEASAETIGDESYQIHKKFPKITVAVDEKRVRGIKKLQQINPKIEIVILDDAFQHRYVKPGLSVLLLDYTQPFFEDFFLPYGRLRDSSKENHRADVILVTKAPKTIKPIDMRIMAVNLELKPYQSLYFSSLNYLKLQPVFDSFTIDADIESFKAENYTVVLVSGIGNFKPLLEYCNKTAKQVVHISLKDHHQYTKKDIALISEKFNSVKTENKLIITTEKDAGKLKHISFENEELKGKMFYLPIEIEILNEEKEGFEKQIFSYVKKSKGQYQFLTTRRQY